MISISICVVGAAASSEFVMRMLGRAILPPGVSWSVTSLAESMSAVAHFALSFCACVGLAAVVVCYLGQVPVWVRAVTVLLPMALGAFTAAILKAGQMRGALAGAEVFNMKSTFAFGQAGLHVVPWSAFACGGLAALGVLAYLRPPRKHVIQKSGSSPT
jgi:hypothetical protein